MKLRKRLCQQGKRMCPCFWTQTEVDPHATGDTEARIPRRHKEAKLLRYAAAPRIHVGNVHFGKNGRAAVGHREPNSGHPVAQGREFDVTVVDQ